MISKMSGIFEKNQNGYPWLDIHRNPELWISWISIWISKVSDSQMQVCERYEADKGGDGFSYVVGSCPEPNCAMNYAGARQDSAGDRNQLWLLDDPGYNAPRAQMASSCDESCPWLVPPPAPEYAAEATCFAVNVVVGVKAMVQRATWVL